jgi:dTDP-4-dehydrorhamnose reductase
MTSALITGSNSVLGEPLRQLLQQQQIEWVAWDRQQVSPDDPEAVRQFLTQTKPDLVFHFAVGPVEWAGQLASICAEREIPFVFTSSVSVFSGSQSGPFLPEALPGAEDEYGQYKRRCERTILQANPQARVARIGWQIGQASGSNNMVAYLENTFRKEGRIPASVNWVQACSFVEDTVDGLYRLAVSFPGGLYHLDSNPGLNFYQVVSGLNRLQGEKWRVEAVTEPRLDNRLLDPRITLRPLTERFTEKRGIP